MSSKLDEALYKGFLSAGFDLSPKKRNVLISLNDDTKEIFLESARLMSKAGFELYATRNTKKFFEKNGVSIKEHVHKIGDNPVKDILKVIGSREIDLIINTPGKNSSSETDGFEIRRYAVESGVSIVTSIDSAITLTKLLCSGLKLEDMELCDVGNY